MNRYIIYLIIFSAINGVYAFFIFDSVIYAYIIFALFIFILFFMCLFHHKRNNEIRRKKKECYKFIEYAIEYYQTNQSIDNLSESYCLRMSYQEREIYNSINDLDELTRLKYMANYYNNQVFEILINMFENGGSNLHPNLNNILSLTAIDQRLIDNQITEQEKAYRTFLIVSIFSGLLITMLSYICRNYINEMVKSINYIIAHIVLFALILITSCILFNKKNHDLFISERGKYEK